MYLLTDGNVVSSRRNSHTLNRLNIIREFNKLHLILAGIDKFFDNRLASSVYKLQFLFLLDKADRIFEVKAAI